MKYLKLFEQAKDFYLAGKKYIITTKDEKYVWYNNSELILFVDINILDESFIDNGFLLKTKKVGEKMIEKHIPGYYKVYFSDVKNFKWCLGDGKYISRKKAEFFEEVRQKNEEDGEIISNPILDFKIIEYDIGGYRKSELNL